MKIRKSTELDRYTRLEFDVLEGDKFHFTEPPGDSPEGLWLGAKTEGRALAAHLNNEHLKTLINIIQFFLDYNRLPKDDEDLENNTSPDDELDTIVDERCEDCIGAGVDELNREHANFISKLTFQLVAHNTDLTPEAAIGIAERTWGKLCDHLDRHLCDTVPAHDDIQS
jgi:hypothetical protein